MWEKNIFFLSEQPGGKLRKIYFCEFRTLIKAKYPNFLCYITLKPVQKKLIF